MQRTLLTTIMLYPKDATHRNECHLVNSLRIGIDQIACMGKQIPPHEADSVERIFRLSSEQCIGAPGTEYAIKEWKAGFNTRSSVFHRKRQITKKLAQKIRPATKHHLVETICNDFV